MSSDTFGDVDFDLVPVTRTRGPNSTDPAAIAKRLDKTKQRQRARVRAGGTYNGHPLACLCHDCLYPPEEIANEDFVPRARVSRRPS